MRTLLGTCTLLLLICTASAQTVGTSTSNSVQQVPESPERAARQAVARASAEVVASENCPVGFSVLRQPAQALRPAQGSQPLAGTGVALDLALAPLQAVAVRSASITVYGLLGPTFIRVGQGSVTV